VSQPARTIPTDPRPARSPRPTTPGGTPVPRKTPPGGIHLRRRRAPRRLGFLVLSTVVVGSMILALAALNTLIAQSSFRIDDLNARIDALARHNLELTREHAKMSAPGRIAEWARRNGMRLPDDIRFLHAHDEPAVSPAGVADRPGEDG
jgi:outer membrane murein-binding lipoprotein Lpp